MAGLPSHLSYRRFLRGRLPEFRGPFGNGHATADDAKPAGLPLHWSEKENVKWKTEIPYLGWLTPVVRDGQVWLTTATEEGNDFYVICLDAATGKVQFKGKLFHADNPEPLGNSVNCYASPSPVLDYSSKGAGRVYVHFGSYGTACLDTATYRTIWQRNDLPCRHYRGPGSSPIMFQDLLILSMDGVDVQYLVALDKKTGALSGKRIARQTGTTWAADGKPTMQGDQRKAFSTPLIINVQGKPTMISSGSKAAYGYDPRTGHELWKVCHGSHTPASRPVFGQGLVMFATGMAKSGLWAVRPDGHGDVTKSQTVWKISSKAVPRMVSPVVVGDLLFLVADIGSVTCLEIATGHQLWQHSVGGRFIASPIYADGRIYFFDLAGKGYVIKPGRTFEPAGHQYARQRLYGIARSSRKGLVRAD